jgi:anti-anti-sigma factor
VEEVPVIDTVGEIDLTHARRFQAVLERAASVARSTVIVSLAGASYFDSQALQVLLLFGRRLTANRRSLLLVAPRAAALRRLLDVVDVAGAFPLFESVEDALAAARSKPASLPPP